jgi:hypothetical protein
MLGVYGIYVARFYEDVQCKYDKSLGIGWLVVVGDGLVPWVVKTRGEVRRGR